MEKNKKEWKKPELIVVTRRSEDEHVLLACKQVRSMPCWEGDAGWGSAPTHS